MMVSGYKSIITGIVPSAKLVVKFYKVASGQARMGFRLYTGYWRSRTDHQRVPKRKIHTPQSFLTDNFIYKTLIKPSNLSN